MGDLISRSELIGELRKDMIGKLLLKKYNLEGYLQKFPDAKPNDPRCRDCPNYIPQETAMDGETVGYCGRGKRFVQGWQRCRERREG